MKGVEIAQKGGTEAIAAFEWQRACLFVKGHIIRRSRVDLTNLWL